MASASDPSGAELRSPNAITREEVNRLDDGATERASRVHADARHMANTVASLAYELRCSIDERERLDAQVSALRQQLADSENWKGRCIAERLDLAAARQEAETLRGQLRESQKDTARLDWLNATRAANDEYGPDVLRESIDAARVAAPREPK